VYDKRIDDRIKKKVTQTGMKRELDSKRSEDPK
jgi:hypothetical protein